MTPRPPARTWLSTSHIRWNPTFPYPPLPHGSPRACLLWWGVAVTSLATLPEPMSGALVFGWRAARCQRGIAVAGTVRQVRADQRGAIKIGRHSAGRKDRAFWKVVAHPVGQRPCANIEVHRQLVAQLAPLAAAVRGVVVDFMENRHAVRSRDGRWQGYYQDAQGAPQESGADSCHDHFQMSGGG